MQAVVVRMASNGKAVPVQARKAWYPKALDKISGGSSEIDGARSIGRQGC